jgi:hypothetical protein
MVLAFIVLGILAPSSKGQDSQYSILLRNVYSHWAPPPNAPIVRGELSVNGDAPLNVEKGGAALLALSL